MATVREKVLKGLYQMDQEGAYSTQVLQEILRDPQLSAVDRAFGTELLMGVVRNRLKLDYILGKFSKIRLKKLSPWVHQILRMGIYQLVTMEKIPPQAACDESVKLAKRYAHKAAQGYVNGLLRSVAREKERISYPEESGERLSVVYSCPLWLTEKLTEQYGSETCEKILEASHWKTPISLRVNSLRGTATELRQKLQEEGVEAEVDPQRSSRLTVTGALNVHHSPSYQEGWYTLQNSSSMEAVEVLAPQAGETVLDLCAAPGGKTTYMAELMGNQGRIFATDIHAHKTELIRRSAERLGISIIETKVWDAMTPMEMWQGRADRVLADVPCSGIGVIHKKPDIKWNRDPKDLEELCRIQKQILENAAGYLRVGGVLVYSTCTILREENQDQIQNFLQSHPSFILEEERLLLTHETGGSGFYIAKLRRER